MLVSFLQDLLVSVRVYVGALRRRAPLLRAVLYRLSHVHRERERECEHECVGVSF